MPHLLVDISSHGYGHLAQTAPILNALVTVIPNLHLTVRCGLPREKLKERISSGFCHVKAASDFGFAMFDPMRVDLETTAQRYRAVHARWHALVEEEAGWLKRVRPDLVFSNVSYLPLAGAHLAGIPAAACCSLNWSDLFAYYFRTSDNANEMGGIAAQICESYQSAPFLALEPAMPMTTLRMRIGIPPVAEGGRNRREEIISRFPGGMGRKLVLVGFGGIPMAEGSYPLARWAEAAEDKGLNCAWLVPEGHATFPNSLDVSRLAIPYRDLMASSDALICKPGYGTFVEAAVAGVPVVWIRRENWPEQEHLISWLTNNTNARELTTEELATNQIAPALADVWARSRKAIQAQGAEQAARWLAARLGASRSFNSDASVV
jgi:hypothetical protein